MAPEHQGPVTLCGAIPDKHDERDKRWSERAGALLTAGFPWDMDARGICPPVDQQLANNCCAHATSAACYLTAKASGTEIPRPSVAYLYSVARLEDGPPPLEDTGSSLRSMFRGMSEVGLVAEERFPEDDDTTNAVPPADALIHGESYTIAAYHRIESGAQLADGVISALQRNRFPVIAMPVDEAFGAMRGAGVYSSPGGAVLGNHAMCVVGWSSPNDAAIVRNSWGVEWGDGGYVMIDRAVLNALVFDCWVLDVEPKGVG